MRWLEVRRHSLTKKGADRGHGSHLSSDGVALARRIGEQVGPVAYVVTNGLPRTIETAIAMGYAVDADVPLPSGYVPGEVAHHDQWQWPQPYVQYARLLADGAGLAEVAARHREVWVDAVENVADGETALTVSSGGSIEPTLVACFPDEDHASWGQPFSHCDGARLAYEAGRFVSLQLSRAPASPAADGSAARAVALKPPSGRSEASP